MNICEVQNATYITRGAQALSHLAVKLNGPSTILFRSMVVMWYSKNSLWSFFFSFTPCTFVLNT